MVSHSSPGIRFPITVLKRVSRIALLVLLVLTLLGSWPGVEAKRPYQTPADIIGTLLMDPPNKWPWPIVRSFAERLPKRVYEPLVNHTPKTIGQCIVRERTPFSTPRHGRVTVCLASNGAGGSYVAVISHRTKDYPVIWDTLIPPSFVSPRIEFVDLDADSIPEVMCSGRMLDSSEREWEIFTWDGESCRLLVPRTDQPASSIVHNRMRGVRVDVLSERDDGFCRLALITDSTAVNWVTLEGSGRRVFRYHQNIGGYLALD